MVPVLTTGGRSFKGAALYYLHDKRREGEAERLTSARVAWTSSINLPTDDPERAWRMMATTAMKADELKAAAGIKATGRKLTKPATAYSLSWHPDERPSQAQQIEAARETLQRLGLGEHQALIVCHQDEPHAHVHVIVNRVHPAEGRAATLSNSKLVLSEWALAYEQKHGKVLCLKREENAGRRQQGERVRNTRVPRAKHERPASSRKDQLQAEFIRTGEAQRDAQLAEKTRAMRDAHTAQWDTLKQSYQDARDRLYAGADEHRQERAAEVRARFKPEWRELFRQQRADRRAFEARERSAFGMILNMMRTAREWRQSGAMPSSRLVALFGLLSHHERAQTFNQMQQREQKVLAGVVSNAVRATGAKLRQDTRAGADRLRETYLRQCTALRESQAKEREGMKEAWATRNAERQAAYASLREKAAQWKRVREQGAIAVAQRGSRANRCRQGGPVLER